MNKKLIQKKIYVKKSLTHGYGVFAGQDFKKGDIIEECYVLISKRGGDRALEDYYFDANGNYALFTGYGSIYNHSDDDNAEYKINNKRKIATITAYKKIKKDEEIFVSYGEEWFSSRGIKPKKMAKK